MNHSSFPDEMNLLKPSEIARILNISRSLAYRLLEGGEIPMVRINSAVRVKKCDLITYINERSVSSNEME